MADATARKTTATEVMSDEDEDEGEPEYECDRCKDRGWIPAMDGHYEYLGNGEIRCPHCMKGLTA